MKWPKADTLLSIKLTQQELITTSALQRLHEFISNNDKDTDMSIDILFCILQDFDLQWSIL